MTEQIPPPRPALTRLLWRFVLVLLAIGFLITLAAVVRGRMSETDLKIMLSSFGGALFASLGLVCAATARRAPGRIGALVGALSAFAGAALLLGGIWFEMAAHIWWWKAMGVAFVVSVLGAHACALLFVPLAGRFEPVRLATRVATWGIAIVLSFMIVTGRSDPSLGRVLSVLATISLFGTLSMPILARLSKDS